MQYPVPQFTDVEDKIIGSLTIIQFGVLFGAGLFAFLIFSATKNLPITIFFFVLFGLPALAVAFGKSNGRPLYKSLPSFLNFFLSPKILVFHKEVPAMGGAVKLKNVELKSSEKILPKVELSKQDKLKQINKLLEQQAQAEANIIKEKE